MLSLDASWFPADHASPWAIVIGVTALLLLALGTAVSMTAFSAGFGLAAVRLPRGLTLHHVTPVLGVAGTSFDAWYGLTALGVDALPL